MKKYNQNGLAAVETVLFVIIFALIAGIGWYVVTQNKDSKDLSSETTKTSNSSVPPASTASNKFVFKEYGVQIAVPNSLKGLTYRAEQGTSITGKSTVFIYLTSDSFKSYLNTCKSTDSAAAFGGINKVAGTYPSNPTSENSEGALLKQFDGFYIEGSADQQSNPCGDDSYSQGVDKERSTLFTALSEAFKTATLVQ
jgi:hypothetical protein